MFKASLSYCLLLFSLLHHQVLAQHEKYALVIGVKTYTHVAPLQNSLNDAKDMSATLKKKGFHVVELYDPPTKRVMQESIRQYFQLVRDKKDAAGLVFYSGHGMQVKGVNYLIPAEANPSIEADLDDQCVNMDYLMRALQEAGNGLNIIILDACRNNPFRSFTRSGEKGLSMVESPKGSYIVYATKPGSVASDGVGRNGLFTSKLLQYINTEGLNIEQVFKQVARDVAIESADQQRPWISSDYTGDFYFTPNANSIGNQLPSGTSFVNSIPANVPTPVNRTSRKLLEAVADDKTRPYGKDNPVFTITYSGLMDGETLDRPPVVTTTATKASLPGTYTITPTGGADTDYDFSYRSGTLTITKLNQRVTLALPAGMKEGPSAYILRGSATSGEPVTYSLVSGNATLNDNLLTVNGPGAIVIKASQKGSAIYEPAEVVVSSEAKARISMIARADDKSRPYGKDNPPLTVTYPGLMDGESIDRPPVITTTATKASLPGTYPITITGGGDEDYDLSYESGSLIITKLSQKVNLTLPPMKEGQGSIALKALSTSGEPVQYELLAGNAKLTDNILTVQGPGPITIKASQKGSAIYEPAEVVVSGEVVARMNLIAKADDKIRPYNTDNPVLTVSYSGLLNGESLKSPSVATTTATRASLPGNYPIIASGGYDDNYNIAYENGTLTITKLIQAVSFFLPDQMLEGDSFELSAMATSGEPVTYEVISGDAKIVNNRLTIHGSGTISVRAIQKGTALYAQAEAVATTEVAGKMTVLARADDQTRPYGMENPPLTVTISGMLNGESADHIDEFPHATTNANKNSIPGTYEIAVAGGTDDQYKFNYKTGTLTITKLFQNVSLSLPKDIKVSTTPYTLTATSSSGAPVSYSLLSGNATLSNDQLTVIGPGLITIKASQIGTSIYEPAETEVTTMAVMPVIAESSGRSSRGSAGKMSLIVKVDDKTRPYGTKNPEFTMRYFGLKSGEAAIDVSPVVSTTATKNSLPGTYPITAEGGMDDDYNFSYQNGTLTITKLAQTINFSLPDGLKQSTTPFTLSAVSSSGEPVIYSLVSGNARLTNNQLTVFGPGPITVKATQAGSAIYEPAEAVATGTPGEAKTTTVNPPARANATSGKMNLIVKIDDKVRPYGAKNPEFTIRYFGLKSGEAAIDLEPIVSTTATKNSLPGTYPITAEGGSDDDYNFSYQNGTLTITKLTQTITFSLPAGLKEGQAPQLLSAVTSSGEPVTYSIVSGNARIENKNQLVVLGAGPISVKAEQTGSAIFEPVETTATATVAKVNTVGAATGKTALASALISTVAGSGTSKPGEFDYGYGSGSVNASVVKVSGKVWLGKNLNVDHFSNGDVIPEISGNKEWEEAGKSGKPAWCYYNNDPQNGVAFGKLYNWHAVKDPRGLCPSGWHVPSDKEWNEFVLAQGDENQLGIRLKSREGWKDDGNGNNETGMNVLPAGLRYINGPFLDLGMNSFWWSSSAGSSLIGWGRSVSYKQTKLLSIDGDKGSGFSVRCVKD